MLLFFMNIYPSFTPARHLEYRKKTTKIKYISKWRFYGSTLRFKNKSCLPLRVNPLVGPKFTIYFLKKGNLRGSEKG